jgi:hypothetical protein
MSGSLDGPVLKLQRAWDHQNYLRHEFAGGTFLDSHPISCEVHRDGSEYRFYVGEIEEFDSDPWVVLRTKQDGSDLGPALDYLFQILDTPDVNRATNLDEDLASFTYINGDLFANSFANADLRRSNSQGASSGLQIRLVSDLASHLRVDVPERNDTC